MARHTDTLGTSFPLSLCVARAILIWVGGTGLLPICPFKGGPRLAVLLRFGRGRFRWFSWGNGCSLLQQNYTVPAVVSVPGIGSGSPGSAGIPNNRSDRSGFWFWFGWRAILHFFPVNLGSGLSHASLLTHGSLSLLHSLMHQSILFAGLSGLL